ncbi:ribonuclease H-like domain-containing protein [Tanacetum coccineum]
MSANDDSLFMMMRNILFMMASLAAEQVADEKERKARTLLLMAVPKDHLRRFHGMDDAKEIWAAIKTRFGGNANSKKMPKADIKKSNKKQEKAKSDGKIACAFDKRKVECFNCYNTGHVARECKLQGTKDGKQAESIEVKFQANDSLYVYGKHGPQPQSPSPTVSNASSIVFSICPSNDSDGELGAVSNDSSTHYSTCQSNDSDGGTMKELQNWNQRMERNLGAGYSFERKPCFVCGSLSHLIKDCDYYEKKMAREAALKSKRVIHADVRQATPAWTNTNRAKFSSGSLHVSSGTHVNSGSLHVNSGTKFKSGASRFNPGKQHVNSGSVQVNTGRVNRPVSNNTSSKSSQVNLKSPKKCFSKQRSPVNRHFSRYTAYKSNKYAVKGKMGTAVKTSAGCVWRKAIPLSNTNSGPTPNSNVTVSRGPQGRPKWVPKRN